MTIKANEDRAARADRLISAQRVIDTNGDRTVADLADDLPDTRVTAILEALAVMRPEAASDVFIPPPARTGPVGELPVRMVTLNDAQVIATTLRGYIQLVDTLRGAVGTSGIDADVRDRLERVILELDVPAS